MPPTVCAVKWAWTHAPIWAASVELPPGPPAPLNVKPAHSRPLTCLGKGLANYIPKVSPPAHAGPARASRAGSGHYGAPPGKAPHSRKLVPYRANVRLVVAVNTRS